MRFYLSEHNIYTTHWQKKEQQKQQQQQRRELKSRIISVTDSHFKMAIDIWIDVQMRSQ